MAISLITGGALSGSAIDGNNVTLTFPGGGDAPLQGDLVLAYGGNSGAGGATDPISVSGPSTTGYTTCYSVTYGNSLPVVGVWYKFMGVTPDTTFVGLGGGSTSNAAAYGCYILRGVSNVVLDAAPVATTALTVSTNPNPSSITTNTDNAWVIPIAFSTVADAAVTAPSGYSNLNGAAGSDTRPINTWAATKLVATAGAEDPGTFGSWASSTWTAVTIAIAPAFGVKTVDGLSLIKGINGLG